MVDAVSIGIDDFIDILEARKSSLDNQIRYVRSLREESEFIGRYSQTLYLYVSRERKGYELSITNSTLLVTSYSVSKRRFKKYYYKQIEQEKTGKSPLAFHTRFLPWLLYTSIRDKLFRTRAKREDPGESHKP